MLEKVLQTCFDLKPHESVLIVTDAGEEEVAGEFEKAARGLAGEVVLLEMPIGKTHGEEPATEIAEAMKSYDVVLLPTTKSLTHTNARKEACEAGARIASMPGITIEMLRSGGLTADYVEIKKTSERLARLLSLAKKVRIATAAGTEFAAEIDARKGIADSGSIVKPGGFCNLPGGEAFISPVEGSANGKLIFDGSFAGIGVLEGPLLVRVKNGVAESVEGFGSEKLSEIFEEFDSSGNVAEIGIGTNPKARLCGNVLEDEKVYGTVHVAFGDSHTIGGKITSAVHLDGIIKAPDVWLDDRKIIEKGSFLRQNQRIRV